MMMIMELLCIMRMRNILIIVKMRRRRGFAYGIPIITRIVVAAINMIMIPNETVSIKTMIDY